jgi:hypothetical protein
MVGSFHPLHRAKWTAHELCHRLVGYGYVQEASPLWNVLAAWAAELLPVALWYFFDEAGLARCERHEGYGPLFGAHCHDCEQAAVSKRRRARRAGDDAWIARGKNYVAAELEAIRRSMARGKPVGTRHASIHLASDALGYVSAHRERLAAPELARFMATFVAEQQGRHGTLESLIERVGEVCSAIVDGTALTPWRASHWDWVTQDLGYRLLAVHGQLRDRGHKRALDAVIEMLSGQRSEAGVTACLRAYIELDRTTKSRDFPSAEDVFAVGYALPHGYGRSTAQVSQGIASALPSTCAALGKRLTPLVSAFLAEDAPIRRPIGLRFAGFLQVSAPGPIADFARMEANITHARPMDAFASALRSQDTRGKLKLSPSAEIVRLDYDVMDAAPRAIARSRKLAKPRFVAVCRAATDDVDLVELPEEVAAKLSTRRSHSHEALGLDASSLSQLLGIGILVPERYAL